MTAFTSSPSRIVVYRVRELPPDLYAKCSRLTMRERGVMQEALRRLRRQRDPNAWAIILVRSKEVLSWALIYQLASPRPKNRATKSPQRRYKVYFYTRKCCRRRGYATRLAAEIRKRGFPDPTVVAWDSASRLFYRSVNMR